MAGENSTLENVRRGLRLVMAVVNTAARALLQQNADDDADIALTLQRCALDRLSIELERLERLSPQRG